MFIYVLQTTPESDPNFGKIPYFIYKKEVLTSSWVFVDGK
jgi:hypothetical protein